MLVGPGARHQLAELLPAGVRRVAVVTQEAVGVEVEAGVPTDLLVVPDGEGAKSFEQVQWLCRRFAAAGLSRSDAVVAVGGGVVTDLAGFAAACFHRGIAYVNIATTLLGQVDAAIGGKTAVNLPEGKNLAGAFWQPRAVLCDTEVLATLPEREWASGRGEMAKYAFIPGPASLDRLASLPLWEQVRRCVATKAALVAADEREGGDRVLLNYGHTLAHALEAMAFDGREPWDLRHGEAVAVGLVFAAELARRLGRIGEPEVQRHRQVVASFGLSSQLPPQASARKLVGFMARDKKAHHDLTFVLDGPRGLELVVGIDPEQVVATLIAMGCRP